ncbi:MAG: hypothetical protein HQM02_03375 [Magnetococcales bacterium]|nr:hypothetical protein [Magnetococcales bacterium]
MARPGKKVPTPPDWEKFRLGVGVGGVLIGVGALLGWGVMTAPDGGSHASGYTTAQRVARMLPTGVQEKIALVLAALCVLFGLFLMISGWMVLVESLLSRFRQGE